MDSPLLLSFYLLYFFSFYLPPSLIPATMCRFHTAPSRPPPNPQASCSPLPPYNSTHTPADCPGDRGRRKGARRRAHAQPDRLFNGRDGRAAKGPKLHLPAVHGARQLRAGACAGGPAAAPGRACAAPRLPSRDARPSRAPADAGAPHSRAGGEHGGDHRAAGAGVLPPACSRPVSRARCSPAPTPPCLRADAPARVPIGPATRRRRRRLPPPISHLPLASVPTTASLSQSLISASLCLLQTLTSTLDHRPSTITFNSMQTPVATRSTPLRRSWATTAWRTSSYSTRTPSCGRGTSPSRRTSATRSCCCTRARLAGLG